MGERRRLWSTGASASLGTRAEAALTACSRPSPPPRWRAPRNACSVPLDRPLLQGYGRPPDLELARRHTGRYGHGDTKRGAPGSCAEEAAPVSRARIRRRLVPLRRGTNRFLGMSGIPDTSKIEA